MKNFKSNLRDIFEVIVSVLTFPPIWILMLIVLGVSFIVLMVNIFLRIPASTIFSFLTGFFFVNWFSNSKTFKRLEIAFGVDDRIEKLTVKRLIRQKYIKESQKEHVLEELKSRRIPRKMEQAIKEIADLYGAQIEEEIIEETSKVFNRRGTRVD